MSEKKPLIIEESGDVPEKLINTLKKHGHQTKVWGHTIDKPFEPVFISITRTGDAEKYLSMKDDLDEPKELERSDESEIQGDE